MYMMYSYMFKIYIVSVCVCVYVSARIEIMYDCRQIKLKAIYRTLQISAITHNRRNFKCVTSRTHCNECISSSIEK